MELQSVLTTEEFVDLVRQHQAALRAYIRSLGVAPLWVDDIAQEALVIAYQKLGEFDCSLSFRAWVWAIAHRCVLNDRRKNARRGRLMHEHVTDILAATSGRHFAADELTDGDRARVAALRECLRQLPDKSRELLNERYVEEIKATDLARKFDMKAATMRKSLERIRAALKKCMQSRLEQAANA